MDEFEARYASLRREVDAAVSAMCADLAPTQVESGLFAVGVCIRQHGDLDGAPLFHVPGSEFRWSWECDTRFEALFLPANASIHELRDLFDWRDDDAQTRVEYAVEDAVFEALIRVRDAGIFDPNRVSFHAFPPFVGYDELLMRAEKLNTEAVYQRVRREFPDVSEWEIENMRRQFRADYEPDTPEPNPALFKKQL